MRAPAVPRTPSKHLPNCNDAALLGSLFAGRLDDGGDTFRLRSAARALGEVLLDLTDRFGLRNAVDRRNLARHAVKCRLVELPFAVGLLRLGLRPEKVADHFGDRDEIARIDLRLVFLRPAAPHCPLNARAAANSLERPLDGVVVGEL